MLINTIICDDNERARYFLHEIVNKIGKNEINIISHAKNGHELIKLSKQTKPDLILLDIDMPGINGIETAKKILETSPNIQFIFTTAYPSFSIECFEVHPFDYLLKPISIERLGRSFDALIKKLSNEQPVPEPMISLTSDYNSYTLKQNDIYFVERAGRKLLIHTRHKQLEIYDSIKNFQGKLNSQLFIRSHNSYLINKQSINKIKKGIGSSYEVFFENYNKPAYISRRNLVAFENVPKNVIDWPIIQGF